MIFLDNNKIKDCFEFVETIPEYCDNKVKISNIVKGYTNRASPKNIIKEIKDISKISTLKKCISFTLNIVNTSENVLQNVQEFINSVKYVQNILLSHYTSEDNLKIEFEGLTGKKYFKVVFFLYFLIDSEESKRKIEEHKNRLNLRRNMLYYLDKHAKFMVISRPNSTTNLTDIEISSVIKSYVTGLKYRLKYYNIGDKIEIYMKSCDINGAEIVGRREILKRSLKLDVYKIRFNIISELKKIIDLKFKGKYRIIMDKGTNDIKITIK